MQKIVTIGPSSCNKDCLIKLKSLGVDCFRINLSHSNNDLLLNYFDLFADTGIVPALDTQGSQSRLFSTSNSRFFDTGDQVKVYFCESNYSIDPGDFSFLCSTPSLIGQLSIGEFIRCDFGELLLKVVSLDLSHSLVICDVVREGTFHNNRAIDFPDSVKSLPSLSAFDRHAISIGLDRGVETFFLSFASSSQDVSEMRELVGDKKIISKIESRQGLSNLDSIVSTSDAILIDRGDLSREISIGVIPFAVDTILAHCINKNKECFVATNILDSMLSEPLPSRAEISDIWNLMSKGISGFVLAAEVAIGKHPVESVAVIEHMINLYNSSLISFVNLIDSKYSHSVLDDGPLKSWL